VVQLSHVGCSDYSAIPHADHNAYAHMMKYILVVNERDLVTCVLLYYYCDDDNDGEEGEEEV